MENLGHYILSKGVIGTVVSTFFREIQVLGLENIPKDQPLIICSNHNNQFIDALLICNKMDRPVKFIIAAKSTRRPIIGQVSKILGGIPVERAQDLAKTGKGKIILIKDGFVKGVDTQFTKDFQVGYIIFINQIGKEYLIQSIISDTELKIKQENPVSDTEVDFKYQIIPKLDQSQMYDKVWDSLVKNEVVGIFPEGGSHDRTDFLPLKAGVCIMALGAMAQFGIQVNIVCCGLNYYNCDKFRSKVIMEFGVPYLIPKEQAELYKTNKREAISSLLHEIQNRLKDVTTSVPSYNELMRIYMARRIYYPENRELTPKEELELNRRFAKGYSEMSDKKEVKQLFNKIGEYRSYLKISGMDDYQIRHYNNQFSHNLSVAIYSIFMIIIYLLFSLPGMVLNTPFGILLNYLSEKERIKCQIASKVKILGKDVVASYKVMIAFVVFPFSALLMTLLFCFFFIPNFLPFLLHIRYKSSLIFLILYPIYIYMMVKYTDRLFMHYKNLKANVTILFNNQQYKNLVAIRQNLQDQIREQVNLYGKDVIQGFQDNRIVKDKQAFTSPSKNKDSKIENVIKKISSNELMGKIFSVLEDLGI